MYNYKYKWKYKHKYKCKWKYKYKYKSEYQFEWWSCSVLESPPATGRSRPTVPTFIKQRSASMTTYQPNFAYKDYFGKISQPEGLLGIKTEQGNFFYEDIFNPTFLNQWPIQSSYHSCKKGFFCY